MLQEFPFSNSPVPNALLWLDKLKLAVVPVLLMKRPREIFLSAVSFRWLLMIIC